MEDFLPGLVKVIEERLGPLGRPFTTLIVVSAGLGVVAWGYGEVDTKLIPLVADRMNILDLPFSVRLAGYVVFCMVVLALFGFWTARPYKREIEELKRELDDYKQKFDEPELD